MGALRGAGAYGEAPILQTPKAKVANSPHRSPSEEFICAAPRPRSDSYRREAVRIGSANPLYSLRHMISWNIPYRSGVV